MSSIISNPPVFRSNIQRKLMKSLETVCGKQEKLATNLEKAIFNYTIKEATSRKIIKKWENPHFVQLYIDRLRSIINNLDNQEIISQIHSGELPVQTFAFMTHQEMKPERWGELIAKKIKRDASRFDTNIEASTDMYKCKKCKSTKCTYYEMQTRSADEPATIFVTCLDCGKHWKG
jgi:DNA-directed RNA polymerase subunit M/transcription elongation factor TFIIS